MKKSLCCDYIVVGDKHGVCRLQSGQRKEGD